MTADTLHYLEQRYFASIGADDPRESPLSQQQKTDLTELRRLADINVRQNLALLMHYATKTHNESLIELIANMAKLRVTLWTTTNALLIAESEVQA